jgi:hypothetical protein
VRDLLDGTYAATYTATRAGTYTVHAALLPRAAADAPLAAQAAQAAQAALAAQGPPPAPPAPPQPQPAALTLGAPPAVLHESGRPASASAGRPRSAAASSGRSRTIAAAAVSASEPLPLPSGLGTVHVAPAAPRALSARPGLLWAVAGETFGPLAAALTLPLPQPLPLTL